MPFLSPSLLDPQLIKGRRRKHKRMPIREHEGDCETIGADGREDNNDGISGRFMVKKDVCAIYFSLQVPVY